MKINLFQEKYSEEPFDEESIRDNPLTKEELLSVRGFSLSDVSEYFRKVKHLYEEALILGQKTELGVSNEYPNDFLELFQDYVQFCYLHRLIDQDTYGDFYKPNMNSKDLLDSSWIHTCQALDGLGVKPYLCYENDTVWGIDSVEEFRMRLEQVFVIKRLGWYLNLKYEKYIIEDVKKSAYSCLKKGKDGTLVEMNAHEIAHLIHTIHEDLKSAEKSIEEHRKKMPTRKILTLYGDHESDQWLLNRKRLERKYQLLEELEDEMNDCFPQCVGVETPPILYIYKGLIRCQKEKHEMIPATAILYDKNDNEVQINVEYCTECDKYYLEYGLFNRYRERYSILIGNFQMYSSSSMYGDNNFALESPLKLSGYNVGQSDGLSKQNREYILARIIHDGIMKKNEVIKYLSHFIRMNGAKTANGIALSKWEDDLSFVQSYDMSIQPRVIIEQVKKY